MKKIDKISRSILAGLTLIICFILFINEDSSWGFIAIIFTAIVYGLSFLSTGFAHKIIDIGDRIDNGFIRGLYYTLLPILLLALCYGVYSGVIYIDNFLPETHELAEALGQALMLLFISAVISIVIILPYVQAIIIRIVRRFVR